VVVVAVGPVRVAVAEVLRLDGRRVVPVLVEPVIDRDLVDRDSDDGSDALR